MLHKRDNTHSLAHKVYDIAYKHVLVFLHRKYRIQILLDFFDDNKHMQLTLQWLVLSGIHRVVNWLASRESIKAIQG